MQSLHLLEIELIKGLQQIRSPALDKFFIFLNFFDTIYFYMMLIPIVWMAVNWRWGLKIMYLMLISFLVNELAKNLFALPRPFEIDPRVGLIFIKGHGFPSGAVQSATLYSGLLISNLKNKKLAWIFSINIVFWLALSRVYLGVHFFSDLIGGFFIGFLLVLAFNYISPKAESFLSNLSLNALAIINLVFCSFLYIFSLPNGSLMAICAFLVGVGLIASKIFNCLLPDTRSFLEGIFKMVLYFMGTALLIFLELKLFSNHSKKTHFLIISALMGIWLSFGMNIVWKSAFSKLKFLK